MTSTFKNVRGERMVNSFTSDDQAAPNIAENPATGGYQVVWQSQGQDGFGWGVFAQNFNRKGNAVGDELSIADLTVGQQENPDVVFNEDGNGMWVWQSSAVWQVGSPQDDVPSAQEFPAANYRTRSKTFGFEEIEGQDDPNYENFERRREQEWSLDVFGKDAIEPAVISMGGDIFANGWYRKDEDRAEFRYVVDQISANTRDVINTTGEIARNFADDGSGDYRLYTRTNFGDIAELREINDIRFGNLQQVIVVTTLSQGAFGENGVIQFQLFTEPSPIQTSWALSDQTILETSGLTGAATRPKVAVLEDGGFAITWQQVGVDGDTDVYVQVFNDDLSERTPVTKAHDDNGENQSKPEITATNDGGFVIVYADADGDNIVAQRFNAEGQRVSDADTVNRTTDGVQSEAAIATLNNGNVVVTWQSDQSEDSGTDVYSQILSLKSTANKAAQYIVGTDANERFSTGAKNDFVDGQGGRDVINGGGKNDTLNGGDGRDKLSGGSGSDTLNGEGGNDSLRGGGGQDTFIFDGGKDTIVDYAAGVDSLVFDRGLGNKLNKKKLDRLSETDGDNLVFDFGKDELTLRNVSSFDDISDDISFI